MKAAEVKLSKQITNGFYFSCEKCGACCKGFDEGEVYIYLKDIKRLVKYLNKNGKNHTLNTFSKKYLKITSQEFYWKVPKTSLGKTYKVDTLGFKFIGDDEHCEFLGKNNLCTVHEARPFQCQAFPIGWNMLVNNLKNMRDYSKKCPGLKKSFDNKGEFYSKTEILEWAQKEYEIEKEHFLKMKKHNFDIFKLYKFLPRDITC